jgi:hypothetical protein
MAAERGRAEHGIRVLLEFFIWDSFVDSNLLQVSTRTSYIRNLPTLTGSSEALIAKKGIRIARMASAEEASR